MIRESTRTYNNVITAMYEGLKGVIITAIFSDNGGYITVCSAISQAECYTTDFVVASLQS